MPRFVLGKVMKLSFVSVIALGWALVACGGSGANIAGGSLVDSGTDSGVSIEASSPEATPDSSTSSESSSESGLSEASPGDDADPAADGGGSDGPQPEGDVYTEAGVDCTALLAKVAATKAAAIQCHPGGIGSCAFGVDDQCGCQVVTGQGELEPETAAYTSAITDLGKSGCSWPCPPTCPAYAIGVCEVRGPDGGPIDGGSSVPTCG